MCTSEKLSDKIFNLWSCYGVFYLGGLPIKSDRGVRMLGVPNFVKNYTIGCPNLQIIILLGFLQGFTFKNY